MNKTPLIFVCSPFQGLYDNMKRAIWLCETVVNNGGQPIAPHIHYPQFMREDYGRKLALEFSKNILSKCDALYCESGYKITDGMQGELDFARENNIPIIYEICNFVQEFKNA